MKVGTLSHSCQQFLMQTLLLIGRANQVVPPNFTSSLSGGWAVWYEESSIRFVILRIYLNLKWSQNPNLLYNCTFMLLMEPCVCDKMNSFLFIALKRDLAEKWAFLGSKERIWECDPISINSTWKPAPIFISDIYNWGSVLNTVIFSLYTAL